MRTNHTLIAVTVVSLLGAGCATEQQTRTAVGTGAGAAAGAVLGTVIGGSGRGTVVGATLGAGLGAAAGYNWDKVREKLGMGTKGSGVDVSQQSDGALKLNVPGSVSFVSGSATLSPRLYETLNNVAATLNEYPDTTVTIIGYTDSVGDSTSNLELSRRRAAAVADYLNQRGVNRSRMIVDGRGEAQPIASNATEDGRAQNRRVEMLIRPTAS